MPEESNMLAIGYSDNAELTELLADLKPGEEKEVKVRYRVRTNDDGVITADISEVMLPSGGSEPVSGPSVDENTGSAVATVLSDENNVADGEKS